MSETVQAILKELNFTRIHDAMLALNWKWTTTSGTRAPSPEEIKERVQKDLEWFASVKAPYSSSGGITMRRHKDGIEVSFEIEAAFAKTP